MDASVTSSCTNQTCTKGLKGIFLGDDPCGCRDCFRPSGKPEEGYLDLESKDSQELLLLKKAIKFRLQNGNHLELVVSRSCHVHSSGRTS